MLIAIILAQIGIAILFMRYLLQRNRGAKQPVRWLVTAGVMGVAAAAASYCVELWLLPDSDSLPLSTALFVGLIEEGCKSLPLAVMLYAGRRLRSVSDGLVYFGICGMVFGVIEDVLYDASGGPLTGLLRIVSIPYFHAAFCMLFGLMLARRKVLRGSWLWPLAAFCLAVALHGLYDFGLSSGRAIGAVASLAITLAINGLIPVAYLWAVRTDQRQGLAANADNLYCWRCGAPNPHHMLYCAHCGSKT